MRALIARTDPEASGFNFTDNRELLMFGEPCARGQDGSCGCERAWIGVTSLKGATLAEVVELPSCFVFPIKEATNRPLLRCITLAANITVGAMVRPIYDWNANEWTFKVVESN